MSVSEPTPAASTGTSARLDWWLALALAGVVLGLLLTTWGAFTHTASLMAPGATLLLLGGGGLGVGLAVREVPLFRLVAGRGRAEDGEGAA